MNLSQVFQNTAPGTVAGATGIAVQAANPQESGIQAEFAEFSAAAVLTAGEDTIADALQLALSPDGKALPDSGGNILPGLAADELAEAGLPSLDDLEAGLESMVLAAPAAPAQAALIDPAQGESASGKAFSDHEGLIQATGRQAQYLRMVASPQAGHAQPAALGEAKLSPSPTLTESSGATTTTMEGKSVTQPQGPAGSSAPVLSAQPGAGIPTGVALPAAASVQPAETVKAQAATPAKAETLPANMADGKEPGTPGRTQLSASGERPAHTATETRDAGLEAQMRPATTPTPNGPQQPATPTVMTGEGPRTVLAPSSDLSTNPANASQRHDFGQLVERLAEAREQARPGRGEMQLSHREFGPVSMQFDITGQSLKVALAASHAGFAPAVHAALADRPVLPPNEAARAETGSQQSHQRQDASSQNPGHQHGAAHGDAQQHREQAARGLRSNGFTEQAAARDAETAGRTPAPSRDKSLFA